MGTRRIREVTLDEIAEATRTIQVAGADAERSLFKLAAWLACLFASLACWAGLLWLIV